MRPIDVLAMIAVVVVLCLAACTDGFQIAHRQTEFTNDVHQTDTHLRAKRQMETFDDGEDLTAPQQQEPEEPGFWDRVVKIAVKLFARFVEWLNS